MSGGGSNDTLKGGAGGDLLNGGSGRDSIEGGSGNDTVTGGGGADRFIFSRGNGGDFVSDFANDIDKIDVSAFGFDRWATFRDTQAIQDAGGDVLLDLALAGGSGSVLLEGFSILEVNRADFII